MKSASTTDVAGSTQLVQCGPEHLAAVRQFFSHVYKPDYVLAKDDALFRWQFGGPGPQTAFHVKLAFVGDQLAGCLGYIPTEVSLTGRIVSGAWTANWIVDPAYRYLMVGPQLMRALLREHEVTLVAGASATARRILPSLGFVYFGDLLRFVSLLNPAEVAALTGTRVDAWPRSAALTPYPTGGAVVERVDRYDDSVAAVWDAGWGAYGAGTRRSAAFLNWRYVMHPRFEYRLFRASIDGTTTGFAVYRIEQARGAAIRVGRVLEVVGRPAAVRSMLDAVLRDAHSEQAAFVDFFCSSARTAAMLWRSGWYRDEELPQQLPMLFQPVDTDRQGIPFLGFVRKSGASRELDAWYVTKGDGDQDRPTLSANV